MTLGSFFHPFACSRSSGCLLLAAVQCPRFGAGLIQCSPEQGISRRDTVFRVRSVVTFATRSGLSWNSRQSLSRCFPSIFNLTRSGSQRSHPFPRLYGLFDKSRMSFPSRRPVLREPSRKLLFIVNIFNSRRKKRARKECDVFTASKNRARLASRTRATGTLARGMLRRCKKTLNSPEGGGR